jgi:hypothetical protein
LTSVASSTNAKALCTAASKQIALRRIGRLLRRCQRDLVIIYPESNRIREPGWNSPHVKVGVLREDLTVLSQ